MYVNKQILCNYNVDCNPQDFLFIGTNYVAFTGALLNQHKFQFLKQYVFNFPNLIRYSKNSNNDIYVNFVGVRVR